jgi:hypothetical protein
MTEQLSTRNDFAGSDETALQQSNAVGVVASHAREESELKAMFAVAQQVQRDERAAFRRAMISCERPRFAEGTTYSFPRGGSQISGPSVKLARELARCFGNVTYDLRIVETSDDEIHIRAVALDLVNVVRVAVEDKFAKKVQRKRGGTTQWVEPDERDLRELVNRRGAICIRNALLQLLPPDLVEDAVDVARQTLESAAEGDLENDRGATLRALLEAFKKIGVRREHIEAFIGRDYNTTTPSQVAQLRQVYRSIADGHTNAASHFDIDDSAQRQSTSDLNDALRAPESVPDASSAAVHDMSGVKPPATPDDAVSAPESTTINDEGSTKDNQDAFAGDSVAPIAHKDVESAAESGSAHETTEHAEAEGNTPEPATANVSAISGLDLEAANLSVFDLVAGCKGFEDMLAWTPNSNRCRQARTKYLQTTTISEAKDTDLRAYYVELAMRVETQQAQ